MVVAVTSVEAAQETGVIEWLALAFEMGVDYDAAVAAKVVGCVTHTRSYECSLTVAMRTRVLVVG